MERGVSSRSIYQHPAPYSQHTVEVAERMVERGAETRTSADGSDRMLIYDRKAAVVSVQGDSAHALAVYELNLVAFMVSSFVRLLPRGWPTRSFHVGRVPLPAS
ncbi:hypothetical protein [Streptomyces sp. NPDC057554]|uniref:hypothetical protein n=1 Tax=Streptomyces sp. NPDC057554 TaxID=3350538 RepID=UPI00368D1656